MGSVAQSSFIDPDNNLAPIVQTIAWFCLSCAFLSVLLRIITRFFILHRLRYEETFVILSFFLALGYYVSMLVPQSIVWGKSLRLVRPSAVDPALKAMYAWQLLYVPCLSFAKLSIPASLYTVSPVRDHKKFIKGLAVVIVLWLISAEFAYAFQCGASQPWNIRSGSCASLDAINYYVDTINVLTDVALIAIPALVVMPLRMALEKRLTIVGLFSTRIFVIAATITKMTYADDLNSTDVTFSSFAYIICSQAVVALSITATCLPYLQPFMESLQSGLLWNEDYSMREKVGNAVVNGSVGNHSGGSMFSRSRRGRRAGGSNASAPNSQARGSDARETFLSNADTEVATHSRAEVVSDAEEIPLAQTPEMANHRISRNVGVRREVTVEVDSNPLPGQAS